MPDAVVHDLVAHELAHVFQVASDNWPDDPCEREADADEQMEARGFSADDIDDWAVAAGIARVILFDSLEAHLEHLFIHGSRTLAPAGHSPTASGK